MKPVIWLQKALQDLDSIGAYIAEDNPAAAYQVLAKIRAAVKSLPYNPQIGRLGRVAGTRELMVGNLPYIVVYKITEDAIYILSVIHTSRKWPEGF